MTIGWRSRKNENFQLLLLERESRVQSPESNGLSVLYPIGPWTLDNGPGLIPSEHHGLDVIFQGIK